MPEIDIDKRAATVAAWWTDTWFIGTTVRDHSAAQRHIIPTLIVAWNEDGLTTAQQLSIVAAATAELCQSTTARVSPEGQSDARRMISAFVRAWRIFEETHSRLGSDTVKGS